MNDQIVTSVLYKMFIILYIYYELLKQVQNTFDRNVIDAGLLCN